jgi:type I restriction enzyme S subunit
MIKKLSDICSFVSGNAWKASEFADEGIPIIRINNMNTNDNDFVYWQGDYDKRYLINKGDLLVSLSGTIKTFQWNGPEALLNQRIVKVVANPDTNQDWVYYQISNVIEQISNKGKHAVIKNVSVNDLRNFEVDVPDFQTQNKIVAILNKASGLVKKRQQTINLVNELMRALFLEMFGDPVSNPHKFKYKKLKEFYVDPKNGTKCGPFGSALKKDEYIESGVPVWNMDNIDKNGNFIKTPNLYIAKEKFITLSSYETINGDIIISRAGTVGKMAVIKSEFEKSIISTNLIRLRLNKELLPEYFVLLMTYCKDGIGRLRKGGDGAFTHMSTNVLDSLEFPYPPLDLQKKYFAKRSKLIVSLEILNSSISYITDLFQSIAQLSFRGKLNLNVTAELDSLLEEIDLHKAENDLYSILSNEEYVNSLVERLNTQKFDSQDLYDKAKHAAFQLLKAEEIITQVYDESSKSLKLAVK